MLVIALTGGIGSGKTTVANLFAKHGAPIIDADVIARDITEPDRPAYFTIISHFGQEVIQPSGKLNRAKLRHIVFNDANERDWLEELLHPLIRNEIVREIDNLDAPYCIVVIPLLLESEYSYTFIDRILVVDSSEDLQIQRATARDKANTAQIKAIIHSQLNREERLKHAHDKILNDGHLEDLQPQVDKLNTFYLDQAKEKIPK